MSAKNILYTFGVILLLLGVIGFFNNPILGIFLSNTTQNLIYAIAGILALVIATAGEGASRTWSRVYGVVFAVLLLIGLVTTDVQVLGLMQNTTANNLLHFIFAAFFLYSGFATGPAMRQAFASDPDRRDSDY